MTAPFDLIIFDCDGVLIDSEPLASRTMAETLTGAGVPMTQSAALEQFTGKSEADIRVDLQALGLMDYDMFAQNWRQRLFSSFATDLRPMNGIAGLIASLDVPICVASNSSHNRLKRSLGMTELWAQFAPRIFSADDVARPKPAPDLVRHCLDRCGARAERTIMIDDSHHGIAAARAAGVQAIGFVDPADPRPDRHGHLSRAGAAHVVSGAAELGAALASLSVPFRSLECPR